MRCLALVTIALIMSRATPASAFCRSTTERAPGDYDATTAGCWVLGTPLFWPSACLGYSMQRSASRKIPYAVAANAVSNAFTRWTGASCPTDGGGRSRASIDVRDLGPSDCSTVGYEKAGAPNQNVIVFRDDDWKLGPAVLGLTTVVYNAETGEIYNADMELNTRDMDPIATEGPVEGYAYDFASVVTHEAGHFLGIAHSDVRESTMFARYDPGQTNMRNLWTDDVAAICSMYGPRGRTAPDGVTQAPRCDPTPRGGYSPRCEDGRDGCLPGTIAPSRSAPMPLVFATAGLVFAVARRRRRASARARGQGAIHLRRS